MAPIYPVRGIRLDRYERFMIRSTRIQGAKLYYEGDYDRVVFSRPERVHTR
jgi:hypothetical protein